MIVRHLLTTFHTNFHCVCVCVCVCVHVDVKLQCRRSVVIIATGREYMGDGSVNQDRVFNMNLNKIYNFCVMP